ncbi:MAG: hypothetical protein KA310_03235 [Pseudomonadales bacterium]|nr:hypothetical protein [Pseudomonadales bacterium]
MKLHFCVMVANRFGVRFPVYLMAEHASAAARGARRYLGFGSVDSIAVEESGRFGARWAPIAWAAEVAS